MRRNRIKAVINVKRGSGRPAQQDRPVTPVTPSSVGTGNNGGGPSLIDSAVRMMGQPSQSVDYHQQLSPMRSPSPANKFEYPKLTLVRSPEKQPPNSPVKGTVGEERDRPDTPGSQSHFGMDYHNLSVSSPHFPVPISPGGIQRPAPSASPGSTFRYVPAGPGPVVNHIHRPSPSPSPNKQIMLYNTNSNSSDSYEVARYMAASTYPSSGPGGIFAPRTPDSYSESHYSANTNSRSQASTPSFSAFSSVLRDPCNSIVGNSDILKQRLSKPPPSLTVSKYQTLRKEFLAKVNTNEATDRKKLTMLHFAFWNPPKSGKKNSSPRSRTVSVSSDYGPETVNDTNTSDPKSGITTRRATVGETPVVSLALRSIRSSIDTDPVPSSISVPEVRSNATGPRVKVGPDGQLIIDEQSLIVETSESQRAKKNLSEMETISGADFEIGSSGLFRNKRTRRGQDWSTKETVRFYKALSMCGTDFSMMTTIFTKRSRAELKAKFKREDRKNPAQISLALSCQEFDPEVGITDEEEDNLDDDNAPDFVLGETPAKSRRRKKSKSCTSSALEEEIEESRAIFSKDEDFSASGTSKTYFADNDKEKETDGNSELKKKPQRKRKDGAGGRPTAAWKTKVIVNEAAGTSFTVRGRRKMSEEATHEPAVKKPKPRTTRRKSSSAKLANQRDAADSSPSITANLHESQNNDTRLFDNIEVLRFDETDPLGYKVKSRTDSSAATDLGSAKESSPAIRTTRRSSSTSSNSNNDTSRQKMDVDKCNPLDGFKRPRPSIPTGVKVLPFRVPGPGGPVRSSPVLVDEIEIEISCQ